MTDYEEFTATHEVDDDRVIVRAVGELDLYSLETLNVAFAHPDLQDRDVVLDLRKVTFIDSSGLGGINRRYRAVTDAGRKFSVCIKGSGSVERIFELSALAQVIPLIEELGEPEGLQAEA